MKIHPSIRNDRPFPSPIDTSDIIEERKEKPYKIPKWYHIVRSEQPIENNFLRPKPTHSSPSPTKV